MFIVLQGVKLTECHGEESKYTCRESLRPEPSRKYLRTVHIAGGIDARRIKGDEQEQKHYPKCVADLVAGATKTSNHRTEANQRANATYESKNQKADSAEAIDD
jgi:hypothetical protein